MGSRFDRFPAARIEIEGDRNAELLLQRLAWRGILHRNADSDRHRRWIAAHFSTGGLQRSAALGQLGGQAKPGGIPAIGVARGELEHARLERCNHNFWAGGAWAARAQFAVGRTVVLSVEIHLALAQ